MLTAIIAAMASRMTNNKNLDPDSGTSAGGSSNRMSRQPQMKKICDMGTYCSLYGFHPVGTNHDSITCRNEWRKPKHNIASTWTNPALVATHIGHLPSEWRLSNKIIPHGRESQPPPTDRDRGML